MISRFGLRRPHPSPATERDRVGISDVPAPTETLSLPPFVTVPVVDSEAADNEHHPEFWYG